MDKIARRHDIDWLRIIAIILVLYFHTGMAFIAEWDWHIQNEDRSNLILEINFFLRQFRMPLLFLISGVGSWFAFRKRSIRQYISERSFRLLIPLLFAMLLIVPPQIYIERIFKGEDYTSFFDFYPTIFTTGPYPAGNLSWHHMWFVLYLFLYSALAAPFFSLVRNQVDQKLKNRLKQLAGKWNLLIIALPAALWYATICYYFPSTNDLIHDGGYFFYWASFFLGGYLIACNDEMWDALKNYKRFYLGLGLLSFIIVNYFRWNNYNFSDHVGLIIGLRFLTSMSGWLFIFAILGYGQVYLNRTHPLLHYSNRAIYPFYIVHQTIIIILAFYIIPLKVEGVLFKYLFLSSLSLILSVACYEYLIRPYRISRVLFGVK